MNAECVTQELKEREGAEEAEEEERMTYISEPHYNLKDTRR